MQTGLMEKILNTSFVQRILDEDEKAKLIVRKKLADQLNEARKGTALPALHAAVNKTEKEMEASRMAFREAEKAFFIAKHNLLSESNRIDQTCRGLEEQLTRVSPVSITAFIEEMNVELERTRKMEITSVPVFGGYDIIGNQVKTGFSSNYRALNRRMAAIRAAISSAKELRFEALTDEEIDLRLQGLRDGLPVVQEEVQKTA